MPIPDKKADRDRPDCDDFSQHINHVPAVIRHFFTVMPELDHHLPRKPDFQQSEGAYPLSYPRQPV